MNLHTTTSSTTDTSKSAAVARGHLTPQQVHDFHTLGYLIVPGLYTSDEVATIKTFFDDLAVKAEPIPDHWVPQLVPNPARPNDSLQRYPRVMYPHRFNDMSRDMMLQEGVHEVLKALLDEEPVACQSMFYYKPPGARGQALHQDNFYLDVMPDTCIAAWLAIDHASPENGGLHVVPNTHELPIQCPDAADPSESFTSHLVNAPKGFKAVPIELDPGDVLFFNGNVIHGSGPNRSKDHWRRAFICHYMRHSSTHISGGYRPVLDFDGQVTPYKTTDGGGPCGGIVKPGSYDKV